MRRYRYRHCRDQHQQNQHRERKPRPGGVQGREETNQDSNKTDSLKIHTNKTEAVLVVEEERTMEDFGEEGVNGDRSRSTQPCLLSEDT